MSQNIHFTGDFMKGDVPLHITINPKLKAKLEKKARQQSVTVAGLLRVIIARECAKEAGK
ncbi:MAG: hypothetical protein WAT74_06615 [Flavobacteriales bacterium]